MVQQQQLSDCEKCHGLRHVRVNGHWFRCECIYPILMAGFIKPAVRNGETVLPPQYKQREPLPLADRVLLGDRLWDEVRYSVWASLEHYFALELTYHYIDSMRMVDIFFNSSTEELTKADLSECDLLIVYLSEFFLSNAAFGPSFGQLLTNRRLQGKPTWVVSKLTPTRVRSLYPREVAEVLFGAATPTPAPAVVVPSEGVVAPVAVVSSGKRKQVSNAERQKPPREYTSEKARRQRKT